MAAAPSRAQAASRSTRLPQHQDRILDAASKLFMEHGFEATS